MAHLRVSGLLQNILYISVILVQLEVTTNTFALAEEYLLVGNRDSIQRVNLDGTKHTTVVDMSGSEVHIFALDFDYSDGFMFWSDLRQKVIRRALLDGTGATTLVNSGLEQPEGIAWDWINKKLYWTDSDHKCIEVLDPATGNRKTLIQTGTTSQPRAIVVDPGTGFLYWADWQENNPRIERATMDGQDRTILHNSSLAVPNGLTLDYTNQQLYWVDAPSSGNEFGDRIETSRADGTERRVVAELQPDKSTSRHPFAITYFNENVYWTDWVVNGLLTRSVNELGNIDVVLNITRPRGLHVVTPLRQQTAENPCAANGCSFLCLLSAGVEEGFRCVCPPELVLHWNGKDCVNPNTISTAPPSTSTLQPSITVATTMPTTATEVTPTPADIDPCAVEPCKNGGECMTETSDYFCVCPEGFAGKDCQFEFTPTADIDPCVAVEPCKNGGQCMRAETSDYFCVCPKGFAGKDCQFEITTEVPRDLCDILSPCKNGGTCMTSEEEGYSCACVDGFEGKHCDEIDATNDTAMESSSSVSISSTIFVAVIGGLVLVIFLMIMGLVAMLAVIRKQRRKRKKLFHTGVSPQPLMTSQRQSADTTSSFNEHEYVSIKSSSPYPTKFQNIPNFPDRNSHQNSFRNNYRFPPSLTGSRNDHLQDPEVGDNPAYDTRSKILTI